MLPIMTLQHPALLEDPFEADCPSCHHHATFTFIGQQKFPEKVAQKIGLPSVIFLWHCSECQTTLSHIELSKCDPQ